MAAQRLIGDILSERRRGLGLSIERVVADTKLQRRMVEAFEDSDFDAMPPKGYAQASLASYARYLGLNPNDILRLYDDQLFEFQRQMSLGASRSARSQRPSRSSDDSRQSRSSRFDGNPANARDSYAECGRSDRNREQQRGYRAHEEPDRYGRDNRAAYDRGAIDSGRPRAGYDESSARGGRGFDARREYSDDRRGYTPDSRAHSSSGRAVDRGLYESGHREPSRRLDAYRSDAPSSSRADTRRSGYDRAPVSSRDGREHDAPIGERGIRGTRDRRVDQRDLRSRDERGQSRTRYDRFAPESPERFRREAETVSLDDGYQGGSGGIDAEDRYQPRSASNAGQRESLSEVLLGFWHSIRSDRRTFLIVVSTVAITLVVVVAVSVSSCIRSNASSNDESGGVIQVTPVGQGSQLSPWVDLNSVPAGSQLELTVSADSTTAPWIEAFVDDETYGEITAPGTTLSWVVNRSATIRMSSIDNVTVTVNGTPVVAVADNGVYVLTLTVADAS